MCIFSSKCKRKSVHFKQKCKREGVFLCKECITRRQILKFSALSTNFSNFVKKKRYIFCKFCKENSMFFYKKKCKRKGVFYPKIARERVQFQKPRWHTRVQKLGKCPPRALRPCSRRPDIPIYRFQRTNIPKNCA